MSTAQDTERAIGVITATTEGYVAKIYGVEGKRRRLAVVARGSIRYMERVCDAYCWLRNAETVAQPVPSYPREDLAGYQARMAEMRRVTTATVANETDPVANGVRWARPASTRMIRRGRLARVMAQSEVFASLKPVCERSNCGLDADV